MSLINLAKTTFLSGPDDKLATIDVYKKSDSTPVNSIQVLENLSFDVNSLNSLLSGKGSKLIPVLKLLNKSKSLDQISSRLFGGNVSLKSLYSDLSSAAKNSLGLTGNLQDKITATFKGLQSDIKIDGFNDAKAIGGLVNEFTNKAYTGSFKDFGGITSLVTNLTRQGAELGLPKVFSTLATYVADDKILASAAGQLLPFASSKGDMNLFLDIASSTIGKQIKGINPGIINAMIKTFRMPAGMDQRQSGPYYNTVNTSFRGVNPTWNKYKKPSGATILAGLAIAGAPSFIKLLKSGVMSEPPVIPTPENAVGPFTRATAEAMDSQFLLAMSKYVPVDVNAQLKELVPRVMVTTNPRFVNYAVE
jgi:hypothetical protein